MHFESFRLNIGNNLAIDFSSDTIKLLYDRRNDIEKMYQAIEMLLLELSPYGVKSEHLYDLVQTFSDVWDDDPDWLKATIH